MRVKSLIVINLSDDFGGAVMTEDREAALGLYDKHTQRSDGGQPDNAWLIELNNTAATGDKDAFVEDSDYKIVQGGPLGAEVNTDNTGVYLVFHAKGSSDPNIFGVTSLGKAEKKGLQATRLVGALKKLGIDRIRKLVLMACNVTNHKTGPSKNFLAAVCKEFAGWEKASRPMIAGYDDYVYGSKSGRKFQDVASQKPMTGSGHKQVWVCKSGLLSGGYKQVSLETSGWSDKDQQETNVETAAIIDH